MAERCVCKPCVFARRVVIVGFGVVLLPFWIVGSIIYGVSTGLFFGEWSFVALGKEDWARAAYLPADPPATKGTE